MSDKEKKEVADNNAEEKINVVPVKENMNIDEIAANDPNGFAMKITPNGRNMIIEYLNSRPMVEVEPFFLAMFDIEDKDPFFNVPWIKRLFDYLRNVCPRGESKPVVLALADSLLLFRKEAKTSEAGADEQAKTSEAKPNMEVVDKKETE